MADLCFRIQSPHKKATQMEGEADTGATQPGFRLPPYSQEGGDSYRTNMYRFIQWQKF